MHDPLGYYLELERWAQRFEQEGDEAMANETRRYMALVFEVLTPEDRKALAARP